MSTRHVGDALASSPPPETRLRLLPGSSAVADTPAARAGARMLVAVHRRAAPQSNTADTVNSPAGTITIGDVVTARSRYEMRVELTDAGGRETRDGRMEVPGVETGSARGLRTVSADAITEIETTSAPTSTRTGFSPSARR